MNAKIYLKKNEELRIKSGHLWVFSNEIADIQGEPQNGDVADLFDSKKNFLGSGFYNRNSLIALRLLTNLKTDNIKKALEENLNKAYQLRKNLYPHRESYRLVFSESDFLPGLIIDKYNNTFVLQIYSFGMELNIKTVIEILKDNFKAENIFSKNEEYFRKLEGLPIEDKIFLGEMSSEIINDGSVKYIIEFGKRQKTGFYFDQSDNRFFIERFANGKKILDAFCNSGGFGLHALKAGAASVTFVDSSLSEIENAKENYKLNEFSGDSEFIVSDVFDFLQEKINQKKYFDIVMIDPPSFAKNRKSVPVAKKGYEKLNKLALQVLSDDGLLVTSSCSHHINRDDFLEIVNNASIKAKKRIQLINLNSASMDHPQIPSMPETFYLKFAVIRSIN